MNRTTRIAPLLLGTLALSSPLLAHPPGMHHGGMHDDMFATMDADHDGRISAQEHAAAAQAMFARADANHDGAVTLDEMQAMHAHRADRDALAEDRQAPADARDATRGAPTGSAAMPGMDHGERMPANGGMHHDMDMRDHFKAMDSDGDGRISAAEHAAGAAAMFAGMDSDHDGFLSRAELKAGHAAMMHGDADDDAAKHGDRDDPHH